MSTGRRIVVLILMAIALYAAGWEWIESFTWHLKGAEYRMGSEMIAEVDRLIENGSLPAMDEKLKWEVIWSLKNAGRRAVDDRLASVGRPTIVLAVLAVAFVILVLPARRARAGHAGA